MEVGEIDRPRGPNRRQRRWLDHHHPTCQFPGCHHAGRFDAHHLIAHLDHHLDHHHNLTVTTHDGHPINTPTTTPHTPRRLNRFPAGKRAACSASRTEIPVDQGSRASPCVVGRRGMV